ncbi:MAG: Lrp/AsnC family transcriptional regulator [Candidatus Thermoplasmatota archaeon]|nr:Lrp/AsnC family transcriptional regulator [Candidatus Thermoplasmatota archaeon]MBU1941506.1 Lrp/AsnC family transcriptional regulator [Candidatus Thermoplasmatota archaeon]
MPKSSRIKIEEDEKQVMRALQKDARQSIDTLATECKFSRQKVWRIMKRLEENKTIWGYHAVVEDEAFNHYRYYLLIKRTTKGVTEDALKTITNRELKKKMQDEDIILEDSYFMHGQYDWLISMTAPDIRHVKKFTEVFNQLFKDYVAKIDILEVIFPVEKNSIQNPNLKKIKELF